MTLSDTTRLWVYQANKPFPAQAVPEIKTTLQSFVQQWVSHNRQLKAGADVLHNRFVILMVDESQADASGCSIDSSVHFLKQLQAQYGVDLFDRMYFSYQAGDEVHTVSREEFVERYANGEINDKTLVFDTLVESKAAFDKGWLKPLSESWHARLV
ncbi:MAG: hypothetical protein RIC19_15885 [Phaeodactylibacter sp.]|uniref:hypothetical protein n=1 Tax=Phaeodactylibacter sp. TaxID=1940289 RepID=UPI0032EF78FC